MNFSQKNVYKMIFIAILYTIIGVWIGYFFTDSIGAFYHRGNTTEIYSTSSITNEDIFASRKIQKTMDLIRKNAYGFDKKTRENIEDAILKSIIAWLWDKHSTYFTKKETTQFEETLRGDFEWIWAVINEHPKGIKIMKIIIWSPAEKAWLKAGDIMIRVGDTSIIGKTTEEAVQVIRWKKWTQANITYKRGEDNTELHVSVTRDRVNVPSVSEKMLENNIGYIEIATFGEHTTSEFIHSWNTLSSSWAKGMILDFRNNGGGYLDTAVDLASIILPERTPVVIIKQNDPKKNEILMTRRWSKSNTSIPVIILINDYSASASEIFAGAMKDHDRAILLGERSYGKWSVQEPFDLGDGSIVKITTARWYTPKDTSIDEKWITPDVTVILSNKDYENIYDRQLKSAQSIIQDQIDNWLSVVATREKYKTNTFNSLTGSIIK
jgi:carboxyl-terminal processing protease